MNDDQAEADFLEVLIQEGDQDALLIADFEAAAQETVQDDHELATAFSAYQQARHRLGEKFRNRGFFPAKPFAGKGKGFGGRPFGKGKGYDNRPRLCRNVSCPQHADCVEFADIGRQNVR